MVYTLDWRWPMYVGYLGEDRLSTRLYPLSYFDYDPPETLTLEDNEQVLPKESLDLVNAFLTRVESSRRDRPEQCRWNA